MKNHLIFDVESLGLHGPSFAFGYTVWNSKCEEVERGLSWCHPSDVYGNLSKESQDRARPGHKWIKENCTPSLEHPHSLQPEPTHDTPQQIRETFWNLRQKWKDATWWADCLWPVEANFLSACIEDDFLSREWSGLFPFYEIASVALVSGLDPIEFPRLAEELPVHNPYQDSLNSARKLFTAFERLDLPF